MSQSLSGGAVSPRRALWLGSICLALAIAAPPAFSEDRVGPPDEQSMTVTAPPARSTEPNVYGTIALPAGTTAMSARWTRIMNARLDNPVLARFTASANGLDRQQQVAFVQNGVNHAVQRSGACRGDDGYWAAAAETLARGQGDCVDIAVAKMEALRRLGFSGTDLYLTTGRIHGGYKAALLVRVGARLWLLDDSSQPLEASHASAYLPSLTYGVGMTWAHARPLASAALN